jgi:hypothetical protein
MKALLASILAIPLATTLACGSDSGTGGTDDECVSAFCGTLVDFKSKSPKEGVDILVLNNETGEPLDLAKWPAFKSGAKGAVSLDFPPEITKVGFKMWGASGGMKFKDSYQFNVGSTEQGKRLYAVWEGTYMGAMSSGGISKSVDKSFGHLAGTIYYKNPSGEEEYVGCVVVEIQDENGKKLAEEKDADGFGAKFAIRYFDTRTDMPTNTKTADGYEWTMTHTNNSRYMVGGVPAGQYKVVARLKDDPTKVLGEVVLRPFAGALSIGNIYVAAGADGKNPSPPNAECTGPTDEK